MKTLSEYRADARAALKGNWFSSAIFVFVYTLIACLISSITEIVPSDRSFLKFPLSIFYILLAAPLAYGICYAFLQQQRGKEMQIGDLVRGYRSPLWSTNILIAVYTILWTLLLIIPGIVKSYSYAMTNFIMADDTSVSGNEAIERSMAMMQGRKCRLFLLDLSFIGWYLLGTLCLFVGIIWVSAYHMQARAAFYESLKEENVELL